MPRPFKCRKKTFYLSDDERSRVVIKVRIHLRPKFEIQTFKAGTRKIDATQSSFPALPTHFDLRQMKKIKEISQPVL